MIKEITPLLVVIFLLSPIISASCSDINLQIKSINTEENYITLQRLIGENEIETNEIREIKIYVNNELKLSDKEGISVLESRRINLPVSLSKGQEIRVDILDEDGSICEYKNALTISEENVYNYPPCDYTKKSKGSWCVGNKVFTQKCVNGQFEDKVLVDCDVLDGICEDAKCVLSGKQESVNEIGTINRTEEETKNQVEEVINSRGENFSSEDNSTQGDNSSSDPIAIVLNWIINLVG